MSDFSEACRYYQCGDCAESERCQCMCHWQPDGEPLGETEESLSKQLPSVIYLQYSEEGTWCTDRQHDTDVKYVLESALKEHDQNFISQFEAKTDELVKILSAAAPIVEVMRVEHGQWTVERYCCENGPCPISNQLAVYDRVKGK